MESLPAGVGEADFPMIWLGVAVVGATVRTRHLPAGPARLEVWQRWWALGALGFGSLWMFLSFVGIPDFMSTAIGFTQTPFETEIGFANLGLAIMASAPPPPRPRPGNASRSASAPACSSGAR